jgi:GGDEF domain-containing protein
MLIDTVTLLVAAGAVVAISGVSFILNTVLRRNEAYGRIWSIAFIAGILETVASLVWATSDDAWWASGVANGAIVLSLGLMWAGCRSYNNRTRAYTWVTLLASILVILAALVEGPDGGYWAGTEVMFLGVIGFSALAGWEAVQGSLKRSVNGRVLSIIYWLVAVYYLLRLIVFVSAGETSEAFLGYFGTNTTAFIAIVLVIVAAISMSVLQPATARREQGSGKRTGSLVIPGVVSAENFEQQAKDWLERSRRDREPLVMLELSIDNLEHISTAFGYEMSDDAIITVGRIACEHTPSATLVGYIRLERFIILTTPPAFGSPVDIIESLQTAIVETAVDAQQGMRALATFGMATTDEFGYAFADLERAAREAMSRAHS